MSNSISNESIWGKLSEMDQKIDKIYNKREETNSVETSEIKSSISIEEVEAVVAKNIKLQEISNDSHFESNLKNIKALNDNILRTKKVVEEIQIPESLKLEDIKILLANKDSIGVGIFRVRKTSLIITVLGILLFILTTFSMKLYSDLDVIEREYYQQYITIQQLQKQIGSLSVKDVAVNKKKKK